MGGARTVCLKEQGFVLTLSRDTLAFIGRGDSAQHRLPLRSLASLDLFDGETSAAGRAAGLGGVLGAALGAVLGALGTRGEQGQPLAQVDETSGIWSGALTGAGLGALLGAAIGSGLKVDRWKRIFPRPSRAQTSGAR
jgi:hypothetical protein